MKTRAYTFLSAALLAGALIMPGAASAEGGEASASAGLYSNYVWRGMTLSDEIVAQTGTGVSYKGFGAGLWMNYDFDSDQLNETDLTLNYAGALGAFGYDVGYIYYGLDGFDDTQELYLGLSYDFVVSPSVTLYWDVDEGDGGFLVTALGYSLPVTEGISVDFGAALSVNLDNAIMGTDDAGETFTGFYNAEFSIATSVPFLDVFSVDVMATWSTAVGDDGKSAISGASVDGEESVIFGGAGVTLAF